MVVCILATSIVLNFVFGSVVIYDHVINRKDRLVVKGKLVFKTTGNIADIVVEMENGETEWIQCYLTWGIIKDLRVGNRYKFYFEREKGEDMWSLVDYRWVK